ncbi:MAG: HAMP domain-containing protein [Clostridia bacterium]|nr:HAMP domain-containing protein [Clostridia bacterium]MBN2883189.1 HAMP domain-containing protein [Clostridia bacterium]
MFKKKLYSYFFFIITISLLISGLIISRISVTKYKSQVEEELRSHAGTLMYYLEENDITDFDVFATELNNRINTFTDDDHDIRLTIISEDGIVLGDSAASIDDMDNHSQRPEIIKAKNEGIGIETRRSDTTGINYMYLAVKMDSGGFLRVSVALSYINSITGSIYKSIFITILISLLLAAFIGVRFTRKFIKPIELLTEHSNEVSAGNLFHRIPFEPRNDELSDLVESFNKTTETLETAFNEISYKNNELNTLLNAINDGIIAVSSDNTILFANNRINEFPGFELIKSGAKINLIKSSGVLNLIEETMTKEESVHRDLISKNAIYSCFSSYFTLEDGKGVIISMQDITKIRKLEKIRYDFVSNVTHELNTPLTSIKGFIETLKEGAIKDTDTAMQFLNIIDIESDRLSNLINDILTLSSIENDTVLTVNERVQVCSVANDALILLNKKIQEKNINVSNEIPPGIYLNADPDRIKQMFINLIDNAVKYNIQGGSIELYLKKSDKYIEIHIKDTGIGIARSHIERLFERFYRVDKGRSREMGGTGLGLSIVKHIALLYNGTVSIESTPGEGSDFCIKLPIQ